MEPRHVLARALSAPERAGCDCACCGPSPFAAAGPRRSVLGANFTDFDALADRHAPDICAGCARLMAGRPGDDPPPLRTMSFSCEVAAPRIFPCDRAWWWALLSAPALLAPTILSWATSRKRHHWLYAGVSTPERYVIGSDHGAIDWTPDSGALCRALTALLAAGARRAEILSGHYQPPTLARIRDVVATHDPTIAATRGQLILDLALWCAPKVERAVEEGATSMINPTDQAAAELLAHVAFGSSVRVNDGKMFWASNGFFVRRVRRYAHMPLGRFVSRLMSECAVGADFGSRAAQHLAALDEGREQEISTAIRERTDLVVALAFDHCKRLKQPQKEMFS